MLQDLSKAATLLNKLQVSRRWVLNAASHKLHGFLPLQPVLPKYSNAG